MDLLIQDNATFHERDLKFEERQGKFEERQAKIQEAHEQFQYEHRQLLKAQVLLTDHVEKLDARVDRIGEKIEALTEAQKHTDERLNALINVVDDLVRRRPPQ